MSENIDRTTVEAILTAHADDLRTMRFELFPIPQDINEVDTVVNHSELLAIGQHEGLNFHADRKSELHRFYPNVDTILAFKPGHMVCAGGAVASSIMQSQERNRPGDADIFFYDTTTEEAESTIRTIFEWVAKKKKGRWYGLRNQNVTTLWIMPKDMGGDLAVLSEKEQVSLFMTSAAKYQFIHRVFPTKGSVIGGFDISACMFMYDGFEIQGLPISLYALRTGYIIVDVSRRSPSFEMRLKKYSKRYGFGLIVPCMSNNEIEMFLRDSPFSLGFASIAVGGCLRITIREECNRIEIASRHYQQQRGETSDYDAGECDYSKLGTVNSIFAIQGKETFLSWEGRNIESLFEKPILAYLSGSELDKRFDRISRHVYDNNDFTSMCRWLGPDRCYKKGTKIDEASYPDVVFMPSQQVVSERCRGQNPLCLDKKEIYILQQVVLSRCLNFQRELSDRMQSGKSLVTWLGQNDNPGRQFTASFHPIANVRGWYNPKMARPLSIGISHGIFKQLKLLQLHGSSEVGWKFLSCMKVPRFGRDILRSICRALWNLYAEDGRRILKRVEEIELGPHRYTKKELDDNLQASLDFE
uniref:Uncharacterized protein n=1 Tax=viral metagenome TaxID=1070528 RepID=A0A6C0CIT9_9ZZZZ